MEYAGCPVRPGRTRCCGRIDLDVALWGRPGDGGARDQPDADGRVIAIVSALLGAKRRLIATRVEPARRLFALQGSQGEFSRTHGVSWFGSFFVTPLAFDGLVGAGGSNGMGYDFFALSC